MFRNQDRSIFREFAPNCQHFKGSTIFLGQFRSRRLYNVLVSTDLPDARRLTSENINDVIAGECEREQSKPSEKFSIARQRTDACTIKFILNYISRMTSHISQRLWTLRHVKF